MRRANSVINCKWFKLAVLVIASWTTFTGASQAPGDKDQECNAPQSFNQEILLDSSNYANLLNGTWTVVDNDNNNDPMEGTSTPTVQKL